MTRVRTVASLWRYPVKSMAGEELQASQAFARGLLGDRAFGILDKQTGKLASAKRPRLWADLLRFSASFVEEPRTNHALPAVRMTLPDGTVVRSDDATLNATLSQILGRPVALASSAPDGVVFDEDWPRETKGEPTKRTIPTDTEETIVEWTAPTGRGLRGAFFDSSAIHLVTMATLDHLAHVNAHARFDVRRFRPNIVVRIDGADGFVENFWNDRVLALGDEVRLRVIRPVVRCVMTMLAQGDLPHDPTVLQTVAQHNRVLTADGTELPCAGVYAEVLSPGIIRRGDPVTLEERSVGTGHPGGRSDLSGEGRG